MPAPADPTGTPIVRRPHVHRCPRCAELRRCNAGCVWTVEEGRPGEPTVLAAGAPLTCPPCRPHAPTDETPAWRRAALSNLVRNVVTVLQSHGWGDREIAAALDAARMRLSAKRRA